MATTIDTLQLEISTSSSNASAEIDKLATSLANLKNVSKLTTVTNNLTKLSTALKGLSASSSGLQNLNSISNSLSELNNIQGAKGLSSTINSLKKIPEITKQLNSNTLIKFGKEMKVLSNILEPIANQLNVVGNGFKNMNTAVNGMNVKKINTSLEKTKKVSSGAFSSLFKFASLTYVFHKVSDTVSTAVNSMNEYIENMNLFKVSMGDYYEDATKYAERLQDLMGIDASEWSRNQGVFMSMANGFGLADDQAYKLSKGLTEVSYDLASFFNIANEEAFLKVRSGLAGELEPLRALGFALSQASLQELAYAKGITKKVSAMSEGEKAQLRYVAIVEQANSMGVIGDFADTLTQPANAMRILKQQVTQMSRALGSVFLPIISQVIPYVQAFVKVLTDLIRRFAVFVGFKMPDLSDRKSGIKDFASGVASADNSLGSASKKAKELKKALMGFDELNIIPSPQEDSGSGGAGISTGGDLGLDLESVWDEAMLSKINSDVDGIIEKFKNMNFASVVDSFVNGIISGAPKVMSMANTMVMWIYDGIITYIPILVDGGVKLVTSLSKGLISGIPNFISKALDLLDGFADMLTVNFPKIVDAGLGFIRNLVKGLMNALPTFIAKAPEIISKFANLINDNAPKVIMAGIGIIKDIVVGIIQAIPTLVANIPKIFKAFMDTFFALNWLSLGSKALTSVSNGMKSVGESLPKTISGWLDKIYNLFKNIGSRLSSLNPFKSIGTGFTNIVKNMLNTGTSLLNKFIGWLNSKLTFSWNGLKIAGKTIFGGGSIQLVKIPLIAQKFEDGGFIEDGLFTMNKGEIAGKFNNGQSVVANNYQIVEGISQGVYEAVMRAMSSSGGSQNFNANITVELDGKQVGKSVVKYHNDVVNQTGLSPLMI